MPRGIEAQALWDSERSFRLLVENVADYALYMLDPIGTVTSWNIGGQRIKGYLPSEIIGQHFSKFYTDADRSKGKPAKALQIAREQGKYEEEGLRVRKDGTFFWASVVIDPIFENSELLGFAKITRDITERREAQDRFEKIQKQLAESQRLDALGQLTGGIAHDFNNLLMVIGGSNQLLKKFVGENEKAQRAIQAIDTASKRGADLTRQLLTFARRQSVNPQVVRVTDILGSIQNVLDVGVGKAIGLDIQSTGNIPSVKVDVSEFETAIINLAINARDAMPDGGSITVHVSNVSEGESDFVAINVSDTGQGIPEDVLTKVFDPFFTTKPVGKGTGLGLSQVHGFAYQAGGRVKIESKLGEGTSVTILLPKNDEEKRGTNEQFTQLKDDKTILLVEDNPEVALATTGLLEQLGYSVRMVSSAEAAIKEIDQDGFDIVMSDIVMPGKMDGLALAHHIRAISPALPILLTTGYSAAIANSVVDFPILKKPYQIHELSNALSKLS
jgi:PAS domain S-box-containing protein